MDYLANMELFGRFDWGVIKIQEGLLLLFMRIFMMHEMLRSIYQGSMYRIGI